MEFGPYLKLLRLQEMIRAHRTEEEHQEALRDRNLGWCAARPGPRTLPLTRRRRPQAHVRRGDRDALLRSPGRPVLRVTKRARWGRDPGWLDRRVRAGAGQMRAARSPPQRESRLQRGRRALRPLASVFSLCASPSTSISQARRVLCFRSKRLTIIVLPRNACRTVCTLAQYAVRFGTGTRPRCSARRST